MARGYPGRVKRLLFGFVLGAVAGAFGYRYAMQEGGEDRLRQTKDQVVAGAGRAATDLKSRIGEFGTNSVEAIKEELERSGTVVREKAKSAGQSIVDAAANTRVTAAVKARLIADPGLPAFSINVDTTDGLVTLSGKVDSHEQLARAIKVALDTDGVRKVVSTLQVSVTK